MDKRYLKVFELCFQSKSEARKQKEAGEAVESSRMEQRRKTLKITPTRRVGSTTRRVQAKIREDKDSGSQRLITIRGLRDGLDESPPDSTSRFVYIKITPQNDGKEFWNDSEEFSCDKEVGKNLEDDVRS